MLKRISAIIFTAFILCLSVGGIMTAIAAELDINIVHTSDMSGTIFKNEENGTIGYGNVLSVKEKLGDPIVIDSGNFLGDTSQKATGLNDKIVYAMNKAGYQYAALGYNDLKYTKAEIDALMQPAEFEIVSSNIKINDEYAFKTTVTKMVYGTKVGIFAVTDCENIGEYQITDPETEAANAVKQLKAGGSKIIIGIVNTQNTYLAKRLVQQNKDITMILESGTNKFLPEGMLENRTLVVNPGSKGNAIGVSAATVDKGVLKSFRTSNYNLANIKTVFPDTNKLEEEMGSAQSEIDILNNDVICVLSEALPAGGTESKSTALGNFAAEIIRNVGGAEIGIVKGSEIKGGLSKEVTGRELNGLFNDNDNIVIKEVTGSNIYKIFELSLNKLVADENGNIDYEASASEGFLQVSGIKVEYNMSYDPGKRVVKITTDSGKKIGSISNKLYTVAGPEKLMNSYSEYLSGTESIGKKENMIQRFRDYFSENKNITVDLEERIIKTDAKKDYMWIVWSVAFSFLAAVIVSYIVAKIVMLLNKKS